MSKIKIIVILILITLFAEFGAYIVNQHIEDNKKLAPEINDTPEVNQHYKLIMIAFQIPLIATILYLICQILIVLGVVTN